MMEIHYYNPITGIYNNTSKYNNKTAIGMIDRLNTNNYGVFYWGVKIFKSIK